MELYIWVIITIILILIIVNILNVFFTNTLSKTKFTVQNNNVIDIKFLTDIETQKFLLNDEDWYVRNLTIYDIYARKVRSKKEYFDKITKGARNFTKQDKGILLSCINEANIFLRNLRYKNINCIDIAMIPWKLALTNGEDYESGFPHTRKDIIFISTDLLNRNMEDITSTLIHEKVHIYQRQNKGRMEETIEHMGFELIEIPYENLKLRRANPDITSEIYKEKITGKTYLFLYNSEKPSSITDVNSENSSSEHPYELMAYDIANQYTQNLTINLFKKKSI